MEAAINGKQWPLSCFGPFKEKLNLIPDDCDVSFEECRVQFLESKVLNTFHIYQQQLMQKIQEANIRMHSLLEPNKDVLQMTVTIYNESRDNSSTNSGTTLQSGNTSFRGEVNAESIFGRDQTNLFLGGNIGGGGINTNSIFGSSTHQNNSASIYSGSVSQSKPLNHNSNTFSLNLAPNNGSAFGVPNAQRQPTNPSIFGQSTFCSPQNTIQLQGIFGQAKNAFGQTTDTKFEQSKGIFKQAASANTFGSQHSNTFGQLNAEEKNTFGSRFGGENTMNSASTGLFGNANSSFMAQSVQQESPPNPFEVQSKSSIIAQQSPEEGPPPFSMQSSPSIGSMGFVNHLPQQPIFQLQSSDIFGNIGKQASQAAVPNFGTQSPYPNSILSGLPNNILTMGAPIAFGSTNQHQSNISISMDEALYSKIDELTPKHLAAFKANEFILGQIPNAPPPKEFC